MKARRSSPHHGPLTREVWLSKVGEWYTPEPTTGCWLWLRSVNAYGYGKQVFNGQTIGAHRVSYTLLIGPIPGGLHLDHLCRTRSCVNPDHLEAVTCRENLHRGETLNALNLRKTHCPRGHELAGDNIIPNSQGIRPCRQCNRDRAREYQRRRRAGLLENGSVLVDTMKKDAAFTRRV